MIKKLSVVLLLLTGCATVNVDYLTPPRLGHAFIAKKVTCVRPTREGIFQIKSAIEGKKLVTHIYGHGGAGLTLATGSVQEGVRLFEENLKANPQFKGQPIRVVGAGVMGMLSAVTLAKKGYQVRVSAKDLKNLASYKAAGIFGPAPDSMMVSHAERAKVDQIAAASYKIYERVASGRHPWLKKGSEAMPIYVGAKTESGLDPLVKMGVIPKPQQVIVDYGNGKRHPATRFESFFINGPVLMAELHQLAREHRIEVTQEEIHHLSEISEPIVFNCSGLGAKKLNNDSQMVPVLGHILLLKNQPDRHQRNYMVLTEIDGKMLYVTPKGEGAIGSSFMKGESNLDAHSEQFDAVLSRAIDHFGQNDKV